MLNISHLSRIGLTDASFSLNQGECVAVCGPSGAGKSLLLRAIADLDPNRGNVTLDGVDREAISGPAWRRLVGYLPAEPGWWADTVGEHFADWSAAVALVEELGLPASADTWPLTRPSTGERLRLALARALLVQPKFLLLDEPTAALDAAAVTLVEQLIARKRKEGLGVLWVTHDAAQALRVAERILAVEAGKVSEQGVEWTAISH